MSAFQQARSRGFTLIELMITVAILALAMGMGVPSYRVWVQNSQIRNAAESIQAGIQRARAEAVKCNTTVAFALGAASSWTVTHVGACGDLAAGSELESRSSNEGSRNVIVTTEPAGATTITFNSLGTVVANTPVSDTLTQVSLDVASTVLDPADSRDLNVTIGVGGNVRMCDPNLATGTSPRAC